MNSALLKQANQDWQMFVNRLSDDERKDLIDLSDAVDNNNLFFYAVSKDAMRFDQVVNRLPKRYLFDELAIPVVYDYYVERKLFELAHDYLIQAESFLTTEGIPISPTVQTLLTRPVSRHLLESLKKSLMTLRSLHPKDIPGATPDAINDKNVLSEFILNELVQSTRVLCDKIHGIKEITQEDRYSDLLLAILRLRFQFWAWGINDQARKGHSTSGVDAGRTDITIESSGNPIALFEALILRGKNQSETEKHVLKCFGYVKYLDRYYIVIYYLGPPTNFETTWSSYKDDVAALNFPAQFAFDNVKDFEDLLHKFENVNHLKIAKSIHGVKGVEMFHIMIDLSR